MFAQPRFPIDLKRRTAPLLRRFSAALMILLIAGCDGEPTPIQLFEPKPQPHPSQPPVAEKPSPPPNNDQNPDEGEPRPEPPEPPSAPPSPEPPPALRRTHYICDNAHSPFSLVHFHSAMNEVSRGRSYRFFDELTSGRVTETRRAQPLYITSDRSEVLFMSTQQGDQFWQLQSQLFWSELDRSHMEGSAQALLALPPPLSAFGNSRQEYPHYFYFLGNNRLLAPSQSADKQSWFYSIYQLKPLSPLVHLNLDPMEWANPVYISSAQTLVFQRVRPQAAHSQYSYLDLSSLLRRLSSVRRGERLDEALAELVHLPQTLANPPHRRSPPQLSWAGEWLWLEQPEPKSPVYLRRWNPRRSPSDWESFQLPEHSHAEFLILMGRGSQQQLLVARSQVGRDSESRFFLQEGAFDFYQWSPTQQNYQMVNSISFPIQVGQSLRRAMSHRAPPTLLFDLIDEGDGRHFVATLRTQVGSQLFRFDRISRDSAALGQSPCRYPSPLREALR